MCSGFLEMLNGYVEAFLTMFGSSINGNKYEIISQAN